MSKYKNLNQYWQFSDRQQYWQFSEREQELLGKYRDANTLLADCLNSDCYVSREVRQEIEDTLLLPIADIRSLAEVRKQGKRERENN